MRYITRHGTCAHGILTIFVAVLALTLMAGPVATSLAEVIYVDIIRTGGNHDGSSWSNAYLYLQDALLEHPAVSGDEIRIAGGTYYPDVDDGHGNVSDDDRDESFRLVNGITLNGGYHGYCDGPCHIDPNERDETTILSGEIQQDADVTNNSYHVLRAYRRADAITIDRFTVKYG